jgi:membrane protein
VRALALALTLALFGITTLGLIAVLPAAISVLPVSNASGNVIALACWPILAGIAILALGIVYRYALDRAQPKWQLRNWGAATATALGLFGSIAFTTFVSNVGS